MANSDNSTSLPAVTRRTLLTGAACVPVSVFVASNPSAAQAGVSPFQIALKKYHHAAARQRAAHVAWVGASEALAPHRAKLDRAESALKGAELAAVGQRGEDIRLDREALLAEVATWPADICGPEALAQLVMFSSRMATKRPVVPVESDAMKMTKGAVGRAKEQFLAAEARLGFDAIDEEFDAASDDLSTIVHEIETLPVSSIDEFAQKAEIMALFDGGCYEFADFLDFVMLHAKDLCITHSPAPATATLERNRTGWGPGLASV